MLYIDKENLTIYVRYYSETKKDHTWIVFNEDFISPLFVESEPKNIDNLVRGFWMDIHPKYIDINIELCKKELLTSDSVGYVNLGSFLFLYQYAWKYEDSHYQILIFNLKTGKIIFNTQLK